MDELFKLYTDSTRSMILTWLWEAKGVDWRDMDSVQKKAVMQSHYRFTRARYESEIVAPARDVKNLLGITAAGVIGTMGFKNECEYIILLVAQESGYLKAGPELTEAIAARDLFEAKYPLS